MTAAVMTPAEQAGVAGLTPQLVDELVHRVANDGERWLEQVGATGYCSHPVRLSGSVRHVDRQTGEVRVAYSTGAEPDAALLVACGNRRASVCPSCSATYKGDARQLVTAGLVGGKGMPAEVSSHPAVFATFTAPSFGAVHSRGRKGPCHPRRSTCPHGRAVCFRRHGEDDPAIGEAICSECFDYDGQVLWNALAPELWRRTTIAMKRVLPRVVGMRASEAKRLVRLQYLKVAEFQKRGAVHFHAVIRLDGVPPEDDASTIVPPPAMFDIEVLDQVVRQAWATAKAPCPPVGGMAEPYVRWGAQLDVRPVKADGNLSAEMVAGYVANYVARRVMSTGPVPCVAAAESVPMAAA